MNKNILIIAGLFLIFSCSTTKTASKKAPTPAGEWEYSITETPQGDFTGILTIARVENSYTAIMNSNGNDLPFESFTFDEATQKVGGEFYYGGTTVNFDGAMNGDDMTGTMSAGGMDFPFKATRKKQE